MKNSWQTKIIMEHLKSLGMPKKTVVSNLIAVDKNKTLEYDITTMSKVFKNF